MNKIRDIYGKMTERERVNLEVERISKEEVGLNMKRMDNGKAVGPDNIPVEVWKCLGEITLEFITKRYNRTMESERMPEELGDSDVNPIFKSKVACVRACVRACGCLCVRACVRACMRVESG